MTNKEIYDILDNSKRQIDALVALNINFAGVNGKTVLYILQKVADSVNFKGDISGKGFRERYKQNQINEYLQNPKYCPVCGKIISFEKRYNKTCSRSCAISLGNTGQHFNEERKKNISKGVINYYNTHTGPTLGKTPWNKGLVQRKRPDNQKFVLLSTAVNQGIIENPYKVEIKDRYVSTSSQIFQEKECCVCHKKYKSYIAKTGNISSSKCCSDECHKQLAIINGYNAHESAVKNGTFKPWQSRKITSYAENFWKTVLDNNNIKYQREFFFDKKYFLDFYIEVDNIKIDLEIDGKQHKYKDRKIHDIERDKYLENKDVVVYRIEWNDIKTEKGNKLMKEKIDGFVDFYNKKTSGCRLQTAVKS